MWCERFYSAYKLNILQDLISGLISVALSGNDTNLYADSISQSVFVR